MVQMLVEARKQDTNLDRAAERLREVTNHGAKRVVLPGVTDLGWTGLSAKTTAYEMTDGKTCRRWRNAAAGDHIDVCAGLLKKIMTNLQCSRHH